MSQPVKAGAAQTSAITRIEPTRVFGGLSSRSRRMVAALIALEQFAASDVSLLIEGETGVGKELAAESVHRASARSEGPFLVFDCAAKSPAVGECELFGDEREAQSGGDVVLGVLELASGGTVLFDHVDELAAPLQQRLLRALERRQLRRLGGSQGVALDLRVISACTRSLRRQVRLGAFDTALYAQVGAESVRIPPLRQRLEDLLPLSREFLASFQPPASTNDIPEHVWAAFHDYEWPGNVRELRNALQRALVVPERALRFFRGA